MMKLYVIRTGQTTWEAEDRFESVAGAPLSEEGKKAIGLAGAEFESLDIKAIYTGGGEAECETADILAKALKLKVRAEEGLHEIDYGLWQGITGAELKRRHPKVHRQWIDSPADVRPSGGETLLEAQERVKAVLKQILKKHKSGAVLFVMRPVVLSLMQCLMTKSDVGSIWDNLNEGFTWGSYEMDAQSL